MELNTDDLAILNSKIGLKHLLAHKKVDVPAALRGARYELKLREVQAELVKMQLWIIAQEKKLMVLFHGGDASEKSAVIRTILAHNNARHYRISVNIPRNEEAITGAWYFQRFINDFPAPGEMVFFDRSWYNRAIAEPVLGLCTQKEYTQFMEDVVPFENLIAKSNIQFMKIYFQIERDEHIKRVKEMKNDPLRKWRMTPWDEQAGELWDQYLEKKNAMLERTHTDTAPWIIIREDSRELELIKAAECILNSVPYQG